MTGEVVETAYVGRTHRPCGICAELVWIPEGCPHFHLGRIPKTRAEIEAARTERKTLRENAKAAKAKAKAKAKANVAAFQDMIYL